MYAAYSAPDLRYRNRDLCKSLRDNIELAFGNVTVFADGAVVHQVPLPAYRRLQFGESR